MNAPALHWEASFRADPVARVLADRHYNRQRVGHPQFVPPGACVVLRTAGGDAYWVASMPKAEYVKHAWAGAWMCSAFRNEGPILSSALIREAVAVTRYLAMRQGHAIPTPHGFITFVDPTKTRRKRDPGRCYVRAGWTRLEQTTASGLVVLQLLPHEFPPAIPPAASELTLAL